MKLRPKRIRVAHLNETMVKGAGSPRSILSLVRGLDRSRFPPYLIVCRPMQPQRDLTGLEVLPPHLPDTRDPLRGALRFAYEVAREVRRLGIHIVHSHWMGGGHLALLAAWLAGAAVVRTVRVAMNPTGTRTGVLACLRDAHTDAWTVLTPDLIPGLQGAVRVPPCRIALTPNGYDLHGLSSPTVGRAEMRRRLGIESDQLLLLSVGRLAPQKDYPTMLDAFRIVAKKLPQARLLIAGEGPERDSMTRRISEAGIEERVRLLGLRDDVPELLGAADIFVMSSLYEGMSGATTEAMAAGLPVVATDVPGISYVLDYGKAGFLVPARRPEELAGAILRTVDDPDARREMAARGRKRAWDNFSQEAMVRRYEAVYDTIMDNWRSRPARRWPAKAVRL